MESCDKWFELQCFVGILVLSERGESLRNQLGKFLGEKGMAFWVVVATRIDPDIFDGVVSK